MSYLPVRVSTLKPEITLGFDVYVQLPHRILLYARKEDGIEDIRIKYLKKKKVRKLFIKDEDEQNYQDYIDRSLNEAMNDSSLSVEDKATMVVDVGESAAERLMEDPQSKQSYNTAKNTSLNLIAALSKSDDLLKGIFDRTITSDDDSPQARMQKHSVNTSSLCISFAEFLGMPSEWIEMLGIAGLYHDMAFKAFDKAGQDLFFKSFSDMTTDEKKVYTTHPKVGAELLQDKDFANAEVINLIMSHEEKRGGAGFPNKKATLEVHEEVLSIAAFYDRNLTCLGKTREEVFEDFSINQIGSYDLEMIKKFKKFVKKAGL